MVGMVAFCSRLFGRCRSLVLTYWFGAYNRRVSGSATRWVASPKFAPQGRKLQIPRQTLSEIAGDGIKYENYYAV